MQWDHLDISQYEPLCIFQLAAACQSNLICFYNQKTVDYKHRSEKIDTSQAVLLHLECKPLLNPSKLLYNPILEAGKEGGVCTGSLCQKIQNPLSCLHTITITINYFIRFTTIYVIGHIGVLHGHQNYSRTTAKTHHELN